MPEPKRKVGRPRKVVEEVNPDCEPASKGYVKCIGRMYHTKQTQAILKHRKESSIMQMIAWTGISAGAFLFYWFGGYNNVIVGAAFAVSLAFMCNSIFVVGGYSDTVNNSQRWGIGFLKAYEPEPKKKDCE